MSEQEKKDRIKKIAIAGVIGVGVYLIIRGRINARSVSDIAEIAEASEIHLGITQFQLQSMLDNPNWTMVWNQPEGLIRLQRFPEVA